MKIIIEGNPKEIAALVFAVQERRNEELLKRSEYVANALWGTSAAFGAELGHKPQSTS